MTIEEFIEARLAEDDDLAAGARRGPQRPDWSEDYGQEFIVVVGVRDGVSDWVVRSTDESRHIARHDPVRVLRQVAYVRSILDAYRIAIAAQDSRKHHAENAFTAGQDAAAVMWLGWSLQQAAAIWAEHPDYRPEWKP